MSRELQGAARKYDEQAKKAKLAPKPDAEPSPAFELPFAQKLIEKAQQMQAERDDGDAAPAAPKPAPKPAPRRRRFLKLLNCKS